MLKSTHHPRNKKPTGMGICGQISPPCEALTPNGRWEG